MEPTRLFHPKFSALDYSCSEMSWRLSSNDRQNQMLIDNLSDLSRRLQPGRRKIRHLLVSLPSAVEDFGNHSAIRALASPAPSRLLLR